MTAEIAILNRQGVALAADSATTIGRKRVWKLGNKLFSLGPHIDIAVMIYGAGDFLSAPWETLIKNFREMHCNNRGFDTVTDCASKSTDYLSSVDFGMESIARLHVNLSSLEIMEEIKENLLYDKKLAFRQQLSENIGKYRGVIDQSFPMIDGAPSRQEFKKEFTEDIHDLASDVYQENITKKLLSDIVDLCYDLHIREYSTDYSTGVVFAGFGRSQMFPEVCHRIVDGRFNGYLRHWKANEKNLNADGSVPGAIMAFGQADIAYLFMEGFARDNREFVSEFLEIFLNERTNQITKDYISDSSQRRVERAMQKKENKTVVEEFNKELNEYIRNTWVSPVLNVVSSFPKEEMAAMAEALVEITTLRRKVDSTLETVGGPTDVAVVSKGDGVVWIKRKHYFSPDLNGDFSRRKAAKVGVVDAS